MRLPDFAAAPLWLNLLLFAAAAAVVWLAGTRLAGYADVIAERTGIGKAFIGALLLGGITSLPEVATVVTASAIGNAPLAVNNLFGGVAMQVAVLAVADAVAGRHALTATIAQPSLLLEGALLILLLTLAAIAILIGDALVLGLGIGSTGILIVSLLGFLLIHQHEPRDTWEPELAAAGDAPRRTSSARARPADEPAASITLSRARFHTVLAALAILVAGFLLARTGDALALQTGLGSSFVGAVLVAIATSLPEVSTTLGAVRLGAYALAISNLLGANILDISILFIADAAYAGAPVLNEVGDFGLTTTLLGILLTSVYLVGMLERRKRAIARLGVDSIIVLAIYAGGLLLLYRIR